MAHKTTINGKTFIEADSLEEALKIWFINPEPFLECLELSKSIKPPQCVVYVLELKNNTVKIGVTQNIERRKSELQRQSGLEICREWHTDLLDRNIAYKVETLCHDEFKEQRGIGEYFTVPFDDACFTVALYGIIVSEGEKIKAEQRQAQ